MLKPGCYECVHRREQPGTCHSSCAHPEAGGAGGLQGLLAAVAGTAVDVGAAAKLGIVAELHGVRRGWFNWPWDFDPVWLNACEGFTAKEVARVEDANDPGLEGEGEPRCR